MVEHRPGFLAELLGPELASPGRADAKSDEWVEHVDQDALEGFAVDVGLQ